jgi:hypothetical protein
MTLSNYNNLLYKLLFRYKPLKSQLQHYDINKSLVSSPTCADIISQPHHFLLLVITYDASAKASVLDLLFGSKYGASPIPTARLPYRSPSPS